MNHIKMKAVLASAAITMALHPTYSQSGEVLDADPKPKPVKDTEPYKELHIAELKTALSEITYRMASVRAKKHWQREELDVLKKHRKVLSGCLSVLENTVEITAEHLLVADEFLDAYRHSS